MKKLWQWSITPMGLMYLQIILTILWAVDAGQAVALGKPEFAQIYLLCAAIWFLIAVSNGYRALKGRS